MIGIIMSDIKEPNLGSHTQQSPAQDQPAQSPETAKIPHSGKLGIELPVQEFDKTSLKEAFEQGLTDVPVSPGQLHKDDADPNLETDTPLANTADRPWYKNTAAKVAGGILAATTLLGIGAKMGQEEEPKSTVPPVTTTETTPTTDAPEVEATTSTTLDGRDSRSVVIERGEGTPENIPVYLTSTDTEGLIEEYNHNLDCIHNSLDPADQEDCVLYLTAGKREGGVYEALMSELNNVNQYRIEHPDYKRKLATNILDQQATDLFAHVVVNFAGNNYDKTWKLEFVRREEVGPLNPLNEDGPVSAWELISKQEVDKSFRLPR